MLEEKNLEYSKSVQQAWFSWSYIDSCSLRIYGRAIKHQLKNKNKFAFKMGFCKVNGKLL